MRFLATADWQLGMTAAFLPEEARVRFRQARVEAIRRIGRLSRERQADFVVVAGDVFESNQLHRRVLAQAFDALREVPVPVFLLPGNHDPLDAGSIYRGVEFVRRCPSHVRVLDGSGVVHAPGGVELVAAPWFSKRPGEDLVGSACDGLAVDPTSWRVLIGHGAVDTLGPDVDDPAAIRVADLRRALADGSIHCAVLGDRHSTTEVEDRVWYPGTPEVTDRDETDPGNVLIIELDDRASTGSAGMRPAVSVERVHVGAWRFIQELDRHVSTDDDVDSLRRWLEALPHKHVTAVWLGLVGHPSLARKAALDDLLEVFRDRFAALILSPRHCDVHVLLATESVDDLAVTGYAWDAATELAETAQRRGLEAEAAEDALGLLHRLAAPAAETGTVRPVVRRRRERLSSS